MDAGSVILKVPDDDAIMEFKEKYFRGSWLAEYDSRSKSEDSGILTGISVTGSLRDNCSSLVLKVSEKLKIPGIWLPNDEVNSVQFVAIKNEHLLSEGYDGEVVGLIVPDVGWACAYNLVEGDFIR